MKTSKVQRVKLIFFDSYLQTIKNSIGSNQFRNLYAYVNNRKQDILKDGRISCALFVSSVLYLFKLITDIHATVKGMAGDMKLSGWQEIKKPRPGAVLIWVASKADNKIYSNHKHAGFFIGRRKAVSNGSSRGAIHAHHWTFGFKNGRPKREIERIFWHKKLSRK